MPVKSILLILVTKIENKIHDDLQKNYDSDMLYIIANSVYQYIYHERLKSRMWSEVYEELKGTAIKDERTAKEIEKDTLKLFKK